MSFSLTVNRLLSATVGRTFRIFPRMRFASERLATLLLFSPLFRLLPAFRPKAKEKDSTPLDQLPPCPTPPPPPPPTKTRTPHRFLDEIDAFNSCGDQERVLRLLNQIGGESSDDPQVLWRLTRAIFDRAKNPETGLTDDEKRQEIERAFDIVSRALELDPDSFETHMWFAIVLESLNRWKPLREKLINSFIIKEHFLNALGINPQSAVLLHCLGSWCFTVASIDLLERKVAQWLFFEPPTSTYEEALGYFLAAEEVSPSFYCFNLLMIAKCYAKLRDDVKKVEYLERVVSFAPLRSEEDQRAVKEAQILLLNL